MTQENEPRDLRLARRAYEAFHEEQPQVWFSELSHDYQMRWVRAIRAAREELNSLPKVGRPAGIRRTIHRGGRASAFSSLDEARTFLDSLPKTGPKSMVIDYDNISDEQRRKVRQAQKYISNRRNR